MYHYALKAHTYTFSHCNYKFDLTFIMIGYIKLYSHVLHISNTCTCSTHLKKNAETNTCTKILFKNLYSTSQVAVKIFNTDKKKTSSNS